MHALPTRSISRRAISWTFGRLRIHVRSAILRVLGLVRPLRVAACALLVISISPLTTTLAFSASASSFTTGAMLATRSSSRSLMIVTPCVARPMVEIPLTEVRTTMPELVITITSSASLTERRQTT